MTRYVVDATVVIHLVREGVEVAAGHELVAPTLIRSQVLSSLHESVARGDVTAKAGLAAAAGGVAAPDPAARRCRPAPPGVGSRDDARLGRDVRRPSTWR